MNTFSYNNNTYNLENTKTIKQQYKNYEYSDIDNIWYAYNNPSRRKENAWEYCKNKCAEFNGYGLKVVGFNKFIFSAGFRFRDDDGREIYCHITPGYDRFMLVEH